jgi:hypothetical protein
VYLQYHDKNQAEETNQNVENTVLEIRHHSRKKYSSEEKVRIVLSDGLGKDEMGTACDEHHESEDISQ